MKKRFVIAFCCLTAAVWAQNPFSGGDGSYGQPYQIGSLTDLQYLAAHVADYSASTYFLLTTDINCNNATLTPIGSLSHPFYGSFNGGGHTISHFSISGSDDQGLFGFIDNGSAVLNVMVSDASVTGLDDVGAVVGHCNQGAVSGCHVVNTTVHAAGNAYNHGGVVGYNNGGTVSGCISDAAVTKGNCSCQNCGGVVGNNLNGACVTNCLYLGATVQGDDNVGAIIGSNTYVAGNCYYTNNAIANAVGASSVSETNVRLAPQDNKDNTMFLSLLGTVPAAFGPIDLTLYGRTLYTDGYWNTLCLPFNLTLAGSVLEGAEARTLTAASFSGDVLRLTFGEPVETLVAGIPYIIKWASGSNIVEPSFSGVTIDNTNRDFFSADGNVGFKGAYAAQTFDDEIGNIRFMGTSNTLNYPLNGASINAFRAYFQMSGAASAPSHIFFHFEEESPTDWLNIPASSEGMKLFRNNALYILKNGVLYDLVGRTITKP